MPKFKNYHLYLFILPGVATSFIFIFLPALFSFFISLFKYSIFEDISFCGLSNYKQIFNDSTFWQSLSNVAKNWGIRIFAEIIIPLFVAILIETISKGKTFFRTIFFVPVVITIASTSMIWRWLYDPQSSIINYYLKIIGIKSVPWISSPNTAMVSVTIMSIWIWWGFNMVIFLAALNAIPNDFYDAAKIDGANFWQKLYYITIPQLKPVLLFIAIITSIRCFQLFEEPYCLTRGTPLNSTLSPVMYIYMQAFSYYHMGYASAMSVVLFLILLMLGYLQLKFLKK